MEHYASFFTASDKPCQNKRPHASEHALFGNQPALAKRVQQGLGPDARWRPVRDHEFLAGRFGEGGPPVPADQ